MRPDREIEKDSQAEVLSTTLGSPSSEPVPSLGGHAVRGGVIVGTAQMIRVGVQMASVVVLSRLLRPEDFGLVAAVTPVIGFISMFQDLGYGQAIVQRREITREQISSIFWTTAALGLVCAIITAVASPAVAWFYRDHRILMITAAASAPLMLGSLMSVPSGLLNRRLNFAGLAISDVAGAIAGLASAIIAALLGARYWSLVISSAVSSLVIVVGYWFFAKWKPDRPRRRFVDKEIGSFGAHLTGFSFVSFFAQNLDNILIGRQAGSVELGFYDRAYKLLYFPIQHINGPLYRVMTPLLSRVQDDKPRLREMFLRSSGQLTLLIVPGMAALVATSYEVISVLFGAHWQPVAPIFLFLGVNGMLLPLGNATDWLFIAQGRTDVMFKLGLYGSAVTVLSFFVGLHFGGTVGLAAAYAFAQYFLKTPVQYAVVGRTGPVTALDLYMQQFPLVAAGGVTMLIVKYVLRGHTSLHGWSLIAAAMLISYLLAIVVTAIRPGGKAVLHESTGLAKRLTSSLRRRA